MKITEEELGHLQHMLGVGIHISKRNWGYRNYFCASPEQEKEFLNLMRNGFVQIGKRDNLYVYYHATELGCVVVGLNKKQTNRALRRP